ncbi:hypothetical protein L6586_002903 [Listeria monocytogenes]|nr:hypothetical protein [Listeria monocytogenes]
MLHIVFSYSPLTDIVTDRPYNLKDIEQWSKEAVHRLPLDFIFEYNIEHQGKRIYSNGSWEITNERLSIGQALIRKLRAFQEEGKITIEQLTGILEILKEGKITKEKVNKKKSNHVEKPTQDLVAAKKEEPLKASTKLEDATPSEEELPEQYEERREPPALPPREMILDDLFEKHMKKKLRKKIYIK